MTILVVLIILLIIVAIATIYIKSKSQPPTYGTSTYEDKQFSESSNYEDKHIPESSNYEDKYIPEPSNRKPKISAEISDDLYGEVQSYCRQNSMTISDLIRKAVKSYIENN